MKAIRAYQDPSLKNRRGEKWKDIPGLEGYFVISNYGRVKRLEYSTVYRNGAEYTKPQKIIKPGVVTQRNNHLHDSVQFLTNRVAVNGSRINLSPARLVYHLFVRSFDLRSHSLVILFKDTDTFNIRPSNLSLVTLREKQKRVFRRKRGLSPFAGFSKKKLAEIRKRIVKTKSKPVVQYALSGRKIANYSSMAEAERSTSVFATSIGMAAAEKAKTAGGYKWKWDVKKS